MQSPDEVFSTLDLDEFAGTDFDHLRFFVPSHHQPVVHTSSQYDPYAEVHPAGMYSMSHVPHRAEGGESLGPSMIPGFAPEIPSMNSDAEIYGETHPKAAPGPRFERDHPPSGSFDTDLYGSAPHNSSPPQGSDHSNSSQSSDHHDRQLIRKFDTFTLLNAIPEVRLHSMMRLEAHNPAAPFLSCTLCGSLCRSPIAHSTLQQKRSHSCLPKYRHKR